MAVVQSDTKVHVGAGQCKGVALGTRCGAAVSRSIAQVRGVFYSILFYACLSISKLVRIDDESGAGWCVGEATHSQSNRGQQS